MEGRPFKEEPEHWPDFEPSASTANLPMEMESSASLLDDAYEYVCAAQAGEESGFGDPLVGGGDDFGMLLQYLGPSSCSSSPAENNNNAAWPNTAAFGMTFTGQQAGSSSSQITDGMFIDDQLAWRPSHSGTSNSLSQVSPPQDIPWKQHNGNNNGSSSSARSLKRRRCSNNSNWLMGNTKHEMDQTFGAEQTDDLEQLDENGNTQQRIIKFEPHQRDAWCQLFDAYQQPMPTMRVSVVADKGFSYSATDGCFVCQKKNHFQISVRIVLPENCAAPQFVRCDDGELRRIEQFALGFCGIKSELPSAQICILQSHADRKPVNYEPVRFTLDEARSPSVHTVGRLHFSAVTQNNQRKSRKPNPEQRYFQLVVRLLAETASGPEIVHAFHSERLIVRASNPAQFEHADSEAIGSWQRDPNGTGALSFAGQVCIGGGGGTVSPPIGDAALSVRGNIALTGQLTRPSDARVKEDIVALDSAEAMARVAQLRLVEYAYKPEVARQWALSEQDRRRVGVIAQELAEVLPEAVKQNGDLLTVDDARIFYDTVAAAQELYRLTGDLGGKLDQVERISRILAKCAQKRRNQMGARGTTGSSMASGLSGLSEFLGATSTAKSLSGAHSHTSLASTDTFDEADEIRERHKSPKRSKREHHFKRFNSNATLCSAKFMQGTIVALVVVMALCLLSMCTLYVLDWHHRMYTLPAHFERQFRPMPSKAAPIEEDGPDEREVGEMVKLMDSTWTPPVGHDVPPLGVFCGHQTGAADNSDSGLPPPVCPEYCCAIGKDFYERLDGETMSELKAAEHSSGYSAPSTSLAVAENASDGALPFPNGVEIKVLDLNVVLDARYCLGASCDARAGRCILYVPLAPNLPTIPLHLRIASTDPTLFVEMCGTLAHFNHKQCQFNSGLVLMSKQKVETVPIVNRVSLDVFELSAGEFRQSAYTFRVGQSTTALCALDSRQRGRTFDEFNLIFYRQCG